MRRALLLFGIAIIVAGCTMPGSSNDGTRQQQEEPKVIQTSGPECVVSGSACSGQDLTKFDGPAEITVEFENHGDNPASVTLGPDGSSVMIASCNADLVGQEEFEAVVTGPQGRRVVDGATAEVGTDEVLTLTWELSIVPEEDASVSSLGYSCPMSFELRFNQDVTTSKQVQIKGSESIPDVQELATTTTSEEPMALKIDSPDHFVAAGGRTLVSEGYLENVGTGEVVEIHDLTARDLDCQNPDTEIRMFGEGPRSGQSYRRVCTKSFDRNSGSTVTDLIYDANYTYKQPLGDVSLSIVSVG